MRTCGAEDLDPIELEKHEHEIQDYRKRLSTEVWKSMSSRVITVPVYFHVLTDSSGNGYINDQTILQQMDILNDAFSGVISNYSECGFEYENFPTTPFNFTLMDIIRTQDDDLFQMETSTSFRERRSLHIGSCDTLNIFTGSANFLGFARFPLACAPAGNTSPDVVNRGDSVLVHYGSLPGGISDRYNEGDTLVHEVGHWLGLFHTFHGDDCDGSGDLVSDTPTQSMSSSGCQIGKDSCPSGDVDPIHNFMDYSDDCCMYMFTAGQIERMIIEYDMYRNVIYPTSEPSAMPTVLPSLDPSLSPSLSPTKMPSSQPSMFPSLTPTITPSTYPSVLPSKNPTLYPSIYPSISPTLFPSLSSFPSFHPNIVPSINPTMLPTNNPFVLKQITIILDVIAQVFISIIALVQAIIGQLTDLYFLK